MSPAQPSEPPAPIRAGHERAGTSGTSHFCCWSLDAPSRSASVVARVGDNAEAAEDGDGVDQPSQKARLIRIDPRDLAMVCNRATYLTDARYQRCSAIAGF
jgi:hypothetical protein